MTLIDMEAESRVNKNLGRMHRGIVVDNADPAEKGRVKLTIEGLIESSCPPDILPWAYPGISTQWRADLGGFTPPPVGACLYVQFAHNNVYAPIYFGAAGETVSGAGAYGSSIRPYDGAVYTGDVAWNEADPTQKAFLNTLAGPESGGEYNVMYGGDHFSDYSHHPGIAHAILRGPNAGKTSTAAGKYQFLKSTWDGVAAKHGITDFSPASQDKAAWYLASDTYAQKTGGGSLEGALNSGDPKAIADAGRLLRGQWTSLPGGIEQGTTTDRFVSTFNKNLAAAQGAAGPSKEKQHYDADQHTTQQGPTVKKTDDQIEANYGINQPPVRQDGSKPETTVGTSFGRVDDATTQAGYANFWTFDRKNNTLDVALASLGINVHADNQGRLWINVDKDVMMTVGGNVHKYVKGMEVAQTDGETFTRKNAAVTEYYEKDIAKTVKGSRIVKVGASDMVVADVSETQANAFRTGSNGSSAATLSVTTFSTESRDVDLPASVDLPEIGGDKGDKYRAEKQKEYDEDKQVETEKRQVYTQEVSRGHSLTAQAAGSAAMVQAEGMLGRVKELILNGVNNRIPGGLMAGFLGQGSGGGLGGIMDMLGGDVMSKIMGFLPKELTGALGMVQNLVGGGSIQSVLQPLLGQAMGQALGQIQQFLPDALKNLPMGLLNSGEISQVLASLTNKDTFSQILTSTIKSQLSSLIPADLLKDDTVSKIIETVMDVNKLGVLPNAQSPASSLENIAPQKIVTDVLSYVNNYTGLDIGHFYQIASGNPTSSGTMKFPYAQDGVRAILAKVTKIYDGTKVPLGSDHTQHIKMIEDTLTEIYPTLTRAQIHDQAMSIHEQL